MLKGLVVAVTYVLAMVFPTKHMACRSKTQRIAGVLRVWCSVDAEVFLCWSLRYAKNRSGYTNASVVLLSNWGWQ